jgi:hypothetical protein
MLWFRCAGQGSITAAHKLLLLLWLLDKLMVFLQKFFMITPIGGYIKVTGTTVTSANIAAECAKIYSVIPPENLADTVSPVVIYAQERNN